MTKLQITLLVLVFAVLLPQKAHAQRFCNFDEPKLIVKLGSKPVKYVRGKSSRYLTSSQGHTAGSILGLADSGMDMQVKPYYELSEQNGRYCVGLKGMKVLWIATPTIYIANDYKRGSCEYTAILAHEQIHIRRTRHFIREYAPKFKKQAQRIMKTMHTQIGPIDAASVKDAKSQLQMQMYNRMVNEFFGRVIPELNRRQRLVDLPEEYAKVFAKCDNW